MFVNRVTRLLMTCTAIATLSAGCGDSGAADPTCDDGIQNGSETGIDCGGDTCPACQLGQECTEDANCANGRCINNLCETGSCQDSIQNGRETDVDCGGDCDPCADGAGCSDGAECASGVCGADDKCAAPTCNDGVANAEETDVDCGGSSCGACADLKKCNTPNDCESQVCPAISGRCAPARCIDETKNGDESAVDCGGSCGATCREGDTCNSNDDCHGGSCDTEGTGVCLATCGDRIQNQDETDVDCGGATCDACGPLKGCSVGTDCTTGSCGEGSTCEFATCGDGVMNQDETGVDCGGNTCNSTCPAGQGCSDNEDCTSGSCDVGVTDLCLGTCTDSEMNQDESDIDCGGATSGCDRCEDGKACIEAGDCASGNCEDNVCSTPRSCAAIAAAGETASGNYTIDPDGSAGPIEPLTVYCDLVSDQGAGYTIHIVTDAALATGNNQQQAYRDKCAEFGMEVVVPRSRAHMRALVGQNGGPINLANVYPKTAGAAGLENWEGRCQGQPCSFFISETNSANDGCGGLEPNGDNTLTSALYMYAAGSNEFGCWNDLVAEEVRVGGYVVCSPNDVGPPAYTSCHDINMNDSLQNVGPDGITGWYMLEDPSTQQQYQAYCDQTTAGGGWTMIANNKRSDGQWTNTNVLDNTVFGLPSIVDSHKSDAWNAVPFTSLMFTNGLFFMAYHGVGDGTTSFNTFVSQIPLGVCPDADIPSYDYQLSLGIEPPGNTLCNTDLYFNAADYDGTGQCATDGPDAFGPHWNSNAGDGCDWDDPGASSFVSEDLGHTIWGDTVRMFVGPPLSIILN